MTVSDIDALIGNRDQLENGLGTEEITRACRMVMLDQLNDEIQVQAERWKAADLAAYEMGLDPGVGQIDIPEIPVGNFYAGPVRSIIDAPLENFPNISMMAFATVPSGSQFDQFDSSDVTMFIETLVTSGPVAEGLEVAHETIVHRRIQRMTAAVAVVVARNQTLLGTAHNLRTPPRGGIGNSSWLKRQDRGAGDRYVLHGSRLQYTLQRHHTTF